MYYKDIIVGRGEIGSSLLEIFKNSYCYDIKDGEINEGDLTCTFLHIAFPYFDSFVKEVKRYKKLFKPEFIIIHSTVPIGTSRLCKAIHSPVIGIHPELTQSLKTFTKFLGGSNESHLAIVADHFRKNGLRIYTFNKPETTELMKILCTTNYGLNIEFTKEVKRLCDKYNVPFEAFTIWNNNYNDGYEKLGHPEYHRYNLVPLMKKIGAHCVLPNCDLIDNDFTKFIKERNGKN